MSFDNNNSTEASMPSAPAPQDDTNDESPVKTYKVAKYIVLPNKDGMLTPYAYCTSDEDDIFSSDEDVLIYGEVSPGMFKHLSKKDIQKNSSSFDSESISNKAKRISILNSIKDLSSKNIVDNNFAIKDQIDIQTKLKQVSKQLSTDNSINAGGNLYGFIEKYSFKKHVLIIGPAGVGKSYDSYKFINTNKVEKEVIIGHAAIEAIDFIGNYIRTEDGGLAWKDGALAKVFRNALAGKKSVLLIDEMLRIPKKEVNAIIGSLTPDNEGNFVLRTGRAINIVDGIASEETLIVPANMIFVIATTNLGSGYDVEEPDTALMDRFRVFHKKSNTKEIAKIIEKKLDDKKFNSLYKPKLLAFFNSIADANKSSDLTKAITTRHISEIIDNAESHNDIKEMALDAACNIVNFDLDGAPNAAQLELYTSLVEKNL